MEAARPATTADVEILVDLERSARAMALTLRGGPVHLRRMPSIGENFVQILSDPAYLILLGTIDDVPVGYAVAQREELPGGAPLATLSNLFVLPEARGVGVGAALLDSVLAWATSSGCAGIDSTALPGDRMTKNFFESYGMVARAISVHHRLGDEPANQESTT